MTTRAHGRRPALLVLLATMVAPACDSPVGPDGFTLEGNWTGTWRFVSAGVMVTDTVAVRLSQGEATATGTWTAASGPSGQLTLEPRTMTSGTVTITQVLLTGQTCAATTTASGTASGQSIEIALADIPPNGSCQWATGHHFSLTRQ